MFDKYIMHNIQFKDYKVNRARKKIIRKRSLWLIGDRKLKIVNG